MTIIDSPQQSPHDHSEACAHVAPKTGVAWFVSSPLRVLALVVAGVFAIDAGGTDDGPGLCVFRRCTGGYCPGCGMTRAARHLTRGELGAAWHDHPWLVLVALQAVIAAAAWGVMRRIGRRINTNRAVLVVGLFNVVLSLSIWIIRLVDGSIPRFF